MGKWIKEDRKELDKLFNAIQDYDTIVVVSLDRLSRSLLHFCKLINIIEQRHLKLIVGKSFVVDCTNKKMDIMTETLLKVISILMNSKEIDML